MSDFERLEEWCHKVHILLRATPFLVGSALSDPDYRDVDVRVIQDDKEFDLLYGSSRLRVRYLNRALSIWGQKETGLIIDFQVQRRTQANRYDGRREPMGNRDWEDIPTSGTPSDQERIDIAKEN